VNERAGSLRSRQRIDLHQASDAGLFKLLRTHRRNFAPPIDPVEVEAISPEPPGGPAYRLQHSEVRQEPEQFLRCAKNGLPFLMGRVHADRVEEERGIAVLSVGGKSLLGHTPPVGLAACSRRSLARISAHIRAGYQRRFR